MIPIADTSKQRKSTPLLRDLWHAVAERQDDSAAVAALAFALRARGEIKDAAKLFERAIRLNPKSEPSYYRNLAQTLLALGRPNEASLVLREAARIKPTSIETVRDLATVLLDLGYTEEAKELFTYAAVRGRDLLSVMRLCECCLSGGSWRATTREIVSLAVPFQEDALYPLVGRALINVGRLDEAKDCFQEVLARTPNDVASLMGLGDVAYAQRDVHLALRFHATARMQKPKDATIAFACFMDWLAAGQLSNAREIFHSARHMICSRWGHGSHYSARAPEWDGSSLNGKTIFLHGPVGMGDTFQHCRFLNFIKDAGGTIVLEVSQPVRSLMQTLSCVDFVICKFDPLPSLHIDFECDLREIFLLLDVPPNLFGPVVPYIFPLFGRRRRWVRCVSAPRCLKVGVVWDGGKLLRLGPLARRSIPLDSLRPLAEIPNAQLFSLQVGSASGDLNHSSWMSDVVNLAPDIHDFVDTAAIISLLDVVVTIDTSVAHLAGAMGKQTFLMLPYLASPRWRISGQDSAWYPTMHVFRTGNPGSWGNVVPQVKEALFGMCNSE